MPPFLDDGSVSVSACLGSTADGSLAPSLTLSCIFHSLSLMVASLLFT